MTHPTRALLRITPIPAKHFRPAFQAMAAMTGDLPLEWTALCDLAAGSDRAAASLHLASAQRGERIVGLILGQLMAGRLASVYPPCLVAGEPRATALALQESLDGQLQLAGARVLQALVPDRGGAEHYEDCSYRHVADLSYLVSLAESFPQEMPQTELTFQAYQSSERERMTGLIERTYEGTLDCPALNGLRTTTEVMEGYEQGSAARRFYFAQHAGTDVGCVLLIDDPRNDHCELVYMGIVPCFRGRRFGRVLTRFAQWDVARIGRSRCMLAVDNANHAALAHYQAAGFVRWTARHVWMKAIA